MLREWTVPLDLQRRGLFVIGAARSGTTVLQDALNDSPGVYLFGEPDFHTDPGTPDFAARFNQKHEAWGNQPTKATVCPEIFDGDAPWLDYVSRLGDVYTLVGSKIVTQASSPPTAIGDLYRFHCRHFYSSHYIFTVRQPTSLVFASREFQEAIDGNPSSFDDFVLNYVRTIGLYLTMRRTMPSVHLVCHGFLNEQTFTSLESKLGVDLSGAWKYYDNDRVRNYSTRTVQEEHRSVLKILEEMFEELKNSLTVDFQQIQLAQNRNNLHPDHLTVLGRMQRRVEVICDSIGAGTTHTL